MFTLKFERCDVTWFNTISSTQQFYKLYNILPILQMRKLRPSQDDIWVSGRTKMSTQVVWLQSPPASLYQKLRLLHCFVSDQMCVYNYVDACLECFGMICGDTAVTRFSVPMSFSKYSTRYSWLNPCPGFCVIKRPQYFKLLGNS